MRETELSVAAHSKYSKKGGMTKEMTKKKGSSLNDMHQFTQGLVIPKKNDNDSIGAKI